MIRKLRTQRDDQQWMLDLALNMRGRVQNFDRWAQHPIYFDNHPVKKYLYRNEYVFDWLKALFSGKRVPKKSGRIAYIKENGDGPWGDCEWTPPIKPGQAYF